MLYCRNSFFSFFKVKQLQSVLKDIECTEMFSGILAGKYLSDPLLFAVDHHDQHLCSPSGFLFFLIQKCILYDGVWLPEKGGGGLLPPFLWGGGE
jgi:hypothetical protein